MWYNDVSCLDTLDMDMRACPSYKAGFDACDPLASVLDWSNRGPARVLRRRCRSEGVDRSPYEDSPLPRSGDGKINSHAPRLPNRSEFTINSVDDHLDRINQYHYPRVEKHGDYITMPPERSWSPPVGSKLHNHVLSPNRARPLLIPNNIEEKYLPKVEELFEKNDHEMMEVSVKQPLKSILNNPLPKTPPQGILKKPKPKIHSDSKSAQEGRRRQRAISESDNFFCGININSALAYDSRLGSYVKRVKDNSGAGYSYGTGLAHSKPAVKSSGASPKTVKHITQKEIHGSTSPVRRSITPIQHSTPTRHEMPQHEASAMPRHDMPRHEVPVMHVLRTTAINNVVESTRVTPTQPAATPRKSSRSPEPRARSKRSGSPDSKESKASPVNPTSPVKKTPKTPKKTIKSPKSPRKTKNKVVANGDVLKLEVSPINTAKNMININTNQIKMETAAVVQDVLNPVLIEESTPKVALPFKIMTESTPAPANRNHTEGSVKATPASKSLRSPSPAVPADLPTPPVPTSPTRQPAIPGKPAKHSDEELIDQAVVKLSNRLNGTAVSPAKLNTVMKEKAKETTRPMLSSLVTINPFKPVPIRKAESALVLPESVKTCLRVSLFPRVPPYLKFIGHDETMPIKVHPAIQKHLKWKLTSITPIVVRKTLMNSGFRLVRSECETSECPHEETVDWIGIWGKHMKSTMFRAIKDGQKMNHFPGTFQIGRKDRLWRNLQKLVTKFGSNEFGIMPKSYVLPHDMKLLKRDWEKYAEENERWIIKPPASARGTGIKVVSRWTQIPKKKAVVVQKYVSKPLLINGNKFDMRLYVLVTSVHPLRIYLYKDGLARFASVKYNDEIESLNDRYMHLTNYSINRLSKNYTPNEDFAACEGHKWTLQTLFSYLESEKKVNIKHLWETLKDLVIKTIIAGEGSISALTKANITSRYNCYELFGIDVLLDEEMKPWLLEVNISPSLHSASPLDLHVKGPLVTTTLNIAQFQVPVKTNLDTIVKEKPHKLNGLPYDGRLYTVYLSKEERDKHIIYTNMADRSIYLRDIISTLTPDDVRHLIQAEDELTQAVDMERVFPTEDTHKYLNFLTGPRYYNRLFDAWETRYAKNRLPGIELLRDLCDIGYHLEVPPVPLKISKNTLWPYLDNIDPLTGTQGENDVDAPSPPVSEQCSSSSVASVEPTASTASIHVARGICGDSIPPRVLPSPLEPCA